jgi:hypothetical protein
VDTLSDWMRTSAWGLPLGMGRAAGGQGWGGRGHIATQSH